MARCSPLLAVSSTAIGAVGTPPDPMVGGSRVGDPASQIFLGGTDLIQKIDCISACDQSQQPSLSRRIDCFMDQHRVAGGVGGWYFLTTLAPMRELLRNLNDGGSTLLWMREAAYALVQACTEARPSNP